MGDKMNNECGPLLQEKAQLKTRLYIRKNLDEASDLLAVSHFLM